MLRKLDDLSRRYGQMPHTWLHLDPADLGLDVEVMEAGKGAARLRVLQLNAGGAWIFPVLPIEE